MIAVMIDRKLDEYHSEIKYTLDYLFTCLGYAYKIINTLAERDDIDILFFYGETVPAVAEVKKIMDHGMVYFIKSERSLLHMGLLEAEHIKSMVKEVTFWHTFPILAKTKFDLPVQSYTEEGLYYGQFNFDIIANIFFSLTAYEERLTRKRDNLDRVDDAAIYMSNYADIPYTADLIKLCEQFFVDGLKETGKYISKKEIWPLAASAAAAFSFNIDSLKKWTFSSFILSFFKDLVTIVTPKSMRSMYKKLVFLATNEEPYWNFADIEAIIKKTLDIKTTYFFGNSSGHRADVDYGTTEREVNSAIKALVADKNELALLASYDATDKSNLLAREKTKLKNSSGAPVNGCRFNYLRYKLDRSSELIEKAGLQYDSSWAPSSKNGFKYGLAFPFRHFNFDKKRAYNFWEIPLIFCDTHLCLADNRYVAAEEAIQNITALRERIVNVSGLCTYNFSISSFTEIKYLKQLLASTLTLFKNKKVFIASYAEITSWWDKREKIDIKEYVDHIEIIFPHDINDFSLSLHGAVSITSVEGAPAKILDKLVTFDKIIENTRVKIMLA